MRINKIVTLLMIFLLSIFLSAKAPIVLLSDWGIKDIYVGVIKGIILKINPDANIIDLTHDIPSFNVKKTAVILLLGSHYFPENTVFLVGVEPGGNVKRRIILKTKNNLYFVGPDNGVFTLVAKNYGIDKIVEISNKKYFLTPNPSQVFSFKDIYAPVCAYLSKGIPIDSFGKKIKDIAYIPFQKSRVIDGKLVGTILFVDKYGNVITNIPNILLEEMNIKKNTKFILIAKDKKIIIPYKSYYGEVSKGNFVACDSFFNLLEIAVNEGNAAKKLNVKEWDKIILIPQK